MRLLNKKQLEKLKRKNRGNSLLCSEVDKLIADFEMHSWENPTDVNKFRQDADCVHSEGFYFFNISIHRTLILIEFDDNEATVVWVGDHKKYEEVFKNNKNTIRHWLRNNDWI